MALIDKASLLMVPSTYEAGKLYNVLPSGNRAPDSTDQNSGYDQTRADFDFDRGSNAAATRVNADGLIEKYRENKLLYSQDYTQSNWNKTNCTITSNYIANPVDGSINAPNITIDQTAGSYEKTMTQQNLNFVSGNVYCVSVWMKAGSVSSDTLRILAYDGGQVHSSSYIYLDDIENTPCKYEAGDNGWNRFYFYFKASNTAAGYIYIFNYAYGQVTNAGTNLYLYGAQWELGTYPTDYLDSTSVTGKAGVLVDLPRINYDANGENGALLLEPSRANNIAYSENITNSWWLKSNVTALDNQGISPEGLNNAGEITLTSTGGAVLYKTSLIIGDGVLSFFAKPGTLSGGRIRVSVDGIGAAYWNLDGTISSVSGGTAEAAENYGNGWFRYSYNVPSGSVANYGVQGGIIGESMLVYGMQVEPNATYPSSYIPNHGESGGVTRAADLMYTGPTDLGGGSVGTLMVEIERIAIDTANTGAGVQLLTSSDNEEIRLHFDAPSSQVRWRDANNGYAQIGAALSVTAGEFFKMCLVSDGTTAKSFGNGAQLGSDYSIVTAFDFDKLSLPQKAYKVKQIYFSNQALTDAECATLTTL